MINKKDWWKYSRDNKYDLEKDIKEFIKKKGNKTLPKVSLPNWMKKTK